MPALMGGSEHQNTRSGMPSSLGVCAWLGSATSTDLGGESVVRESRDQADDCARNADSDGDQIRAGERRRRGQTVDAARHPFDLARSRRAYRVRG